MTATAKTRTETKAETGLETARYAVGAISTVAALIGIWGMACLIGGIASNGLGGLLKGYISAITGM